MYDFYSTAAFEQAFTYSGNDLGATWSKDKTFFRIWAPTAKNVSVTLYRSGTHGTPDAIVTIPMQYDKQGTWLVEVPGDLNGIYYTYSVAVNGQNNEVCDPYARSTGVNGMRSMILDLSSTNPAGWDSDKDPHFGESITDAIIYEMHIRDMTMHSSSGIKHKGKFLGVIESGKIKGGLPTGLNHLKSLGITHLHLLPIYDFGSIDESNCEKQYNWGYDPVNFNVPEGSYSTNPNDGTVRVAEMKRMVKGLHDNGISVIMDVVYNHVYHHEEFCFNRIVPGYFTRIDSHGNLSNGSCCGNDTASERSMVRKYIVDSVNYWADEYHIDGFRFDLVGLLDTDTINEIIDTVHQKHPNVIFYGEGWSINTQLTKPDCRLTTQNNSSLVPKFAFFSDTIRDLLRGSIFDSHLPGFISGKICSKDELEANFMGVPMWSANPSQCVNYVSCHDNHTLWDKITLSTPNKPFEQRIRMNYLAAAFYILAQGVPFMQAGEEFLRSKSIRGGKFDANSYKSSDSVNSIKWNTLCKEDYQKTFAYYKGLIAFRKAHSVLHLTSREEVWQRIHPIHFQNPHVLSFLIDGDDEQIFVIFNADSNVVNADLPEGIWQLYIQDTLAGNIPLGQAQDTVAVSPISTLVLVQEKPVKPTEVVAALIWMKDKFLICQRPANKARGLLWEFVGGKVEKGESMAAALIRECQEELDIAVDVGQQFMQVIHEYPDILIRLTLFHCTIPKGFPKALEHNDIRWIHPCEIDNFEFCPADKDILKEIKRIYGKKQPL